MMQKKAFDKMQHPFVIKTLKKPAGSKLLQFDKGHIQKAHSQTTLDRERLDAFS